ncbi:hypothetical protein E2C01_095722 [Portunus trituberculatus]|uniref:Uncharacterized protein n=1 Tax=Portunus trituberculatus TaxID=210409 RepID=A0A5B7JQK2_PORTR|nr:hypothetical protein [Portunus trituberculatus]
MPTLVFLRPCPADLGIARGIKGASVPGVPHSPSFTHPKAYYPVRLSVTFELHFYRVLVRLIARRPVPAARRSLASISRGRNYA